MTTHATTIVFQDDAPLINLNRQCDGYLSDHGRELAEFLSGYQVGNGVPVGLAEDAKYAAGMPDLAAQLVMHFKQQSRHGGFYLEPLEDLAEAEWLYEVRLDTTNVLSVNVLHWGSLVFHGSPEKMERFAGLAYQ